MSNATQQAARPLRINWILARANMSGGVKANRMIAEAMMRRGHSVNLCYVVGDLPWPRPWRVGLLAKRLWREMQLSDKQRHQLEGATANLVPVKSDRVRAEDTPDADVCIASWWAVREEIESWPASKGVKVHLIRGYELFAGDPTRVAAVYRLPGVQLVVSGWLKRMMAEEYGRDATLVPDAVDWSWFQSQPRGKSPDPIVGMVYSAAELKQATVAFEAIRSIQKQMPSLRIVSFGADALRHTPPPRFEYHQRPPQSLIPQLYQKTNCWLIPSRTEGFGLPGLEAAASHCPLVSTRCGGPEDYIQDGVNGYLVPVGCPRAMADAMLRILQLDDARWRKMSASSHAVASSFSWDRSAAKLEATLLSVLDRSPTNSE